MPPPVPPGLCPIELANLSEGELDQLVAAMAVLGSLPPHLELFPAGGTGLGPQLDIDQARYTLRTIVALRLRHDAAQP